jgi:hypothetical protein
MAGSLAASTVVRKVGTIGAPLEREAGARPSNKNTRDDVLSHSGRTTAIAAQSIGAETGFCVTSMAYRPLSQTLSEAQMRGWLNPS